jgi:hypothetical protein
MAAMFVALSGTAYAANTIGSADIIDESIRSQDIRNGEVKVTDVGQAAVATDELATGAVRSSDVLDAGLTGIDIASNSLKGADVDESSLVLPGPFPFSGPVGSPPVGPYYVFRGPTVHLTTTSAQPMITGAASAPLGLDGGPAPGTEVAKIGLCYDATPGVAPPPVNFVGNDYQTTELDTPIRMQAATASVVPAPGTYEVGFCVEKQSGQAVIGDFVNGWVMLTGI